VPGSTSPLRIVNVMLGRGLGGLEQAMLDYADALNLFGHHMHAVVRPDAAVRAALEKRPGEVHTLAHLGVWDIIAATRLRRLLQRVRPDVSIAHGNRAMSLLRQAGADPLIAVLPNYKMKCRGATAVFYPTLDLKRFAQRQKPGENHLYHIPSMVNVPPSPPQRVNHEPPIIGAMGRFVAKKGFALFITALGLMRSQDIGFRAVLAGEGPEHTSLHRLAAVSGLQDVLAFPGWVADKEAFFESIDVFCLPSQHEPFGIVLIEAMAHAMPIVATDSEGPSEILRDGTHAALVSRGDAEHLAQALTAMIAEPDRAACLGNNAYREARETYHLPHVGARLEQAIRHVLEQKSMQSSSAIEATA
jgi:glycosyltransferase involved in cell wall biosynthesis